MSDQHKRNVRFHPSAEAQGFPAPDCYKSSVSVILLSIQLKLSENA